MCECIYICIYKGQSPICVCGVCILYMYVCMFYVGHPPGSAQGSRWLIRKSYAVQWQLPRLGLPEKTSRTSGWVHPVRCWIMHWNILCRGSILIYKTHYSVFLWRRRLLWFWSLWWLMWRSWVGGGYSTVVLSSTAAVASSSTSSWWGQLIVVPGRRQSMV